MNSFPGVSLLGQSAGDLIQRIQGPTLTTIADQLVVHARTLIDPQSECFLDYRELQKPFWRSRGGIFIVPPAMQTLAIASAISHERAFAKAARDTLLAIIDHQLADSASLAWGSKTSGWRHGEAHDKFLFALGVWSVLEFAGDAFATEHRTKIHTFLLDSLNISLAVRHGDHANITNNRGVRGLLSSVIWTLLLDAFEPVKEREAILDRGWIGLEKHLYFVFDAQGAPYEGPAYAGNTLGSLALLAEVLRCAGKPNLLLHRAFERHPRYLAYELVPGRSSVNNLNDSANPCGSVSGCLHWMTKPGGEIIPWITRQLDLAPVRTGENETVRGPVIDEFINFVLWWDDAVPVRSPQDLGWPDSAVFPMRGVVSHRTGWREDDLLVSHFCGRQEVLCHRQGDQNHLALYAHGDRLLVDAGYGSEVKSMDQAMDRWFGLTEAHNCVLIDGLNQRGVIESPGWSEGEMLDFSNEPARSTSLGDASSATGVDHRIRQSLRRVTLHRQTTVPVVSVVDLNERDGGTFVTEILWHTHPDHRWTLTDHGGIIHATKLDCHVFVFNLHQKPFGLFVETGFGRPRLRVRCEAPRSKFVTLFVPLPTGQPAPQAQCDGEEFRLTTSAGTFVVPIRTEG